jgi:hypothetical protein
VYDFAAMQQYNCPLQMTSRTTTLQEIMEVVARETELHERPVVRSAKLVNDTRTVNKALLSKYEVNCAVLLHTLPPARATDYTEYPFASRLGFIHFIPEADFDFATATITDVGFLGLFPKPVLRELQRYARELKNLNQDVDTFDMLLEKLVGAFIYRAIRIQKIIHIMLARVKDSLEAFEKEQDTDDPSHGHDITSVSTSVTQTTPLPQPSPPAKRKCYGTKCRILQVKGIIPDAMLCTANRNLCSGCTNENQKQSRVARIEHELLATDASNSTLAPLLAHRIHPISIGGFRKLLKCLPSFATKARNDHKYGAARYVANTIGILLVATHNCNHLDPPMTTRKSNNVWRQARLFCKCFDTTTTRKVYGNRTFCTSCSYLIAHPSIAHVTKCPGCNLNESWENIGATCLACQIATITFRNPFQRRYQIFTENWLPNSDEENSDEDAAPPPAPDRCLPSASPYTEDELYRMRQSSISSSFEELKSKSSSGQTSYVFENLILLQNSVKQSFITQKRDLESHHESNATPSCLDEENLSPKKTNLIEKKHPNSTLTDTERSTNTTRPPLMPLDLNSNDDISRQQSVSLGRDARRSNRTAQKKEQRQNKRNTSILDSQTTFNGTVGKFKSLANSDGDPNILIATL